jgi:hypothetical protein
MSHFAEVGRRTFGVAIDPPPAFDPPGPAALGG